MKILNLINVFFKKVNNDHVGEYAAQCAYFTFLSFIPFIILLLSLIKYMNIERDTLIYILEAFLPTITKNSVLDIIQEVYSKSFETVSISVIFTLWSAANSFYSLSVGLHAIYKKEESNENHFLLRIKGILATIIILFSIIMALILLVFGNRINFIIEEKFTGHIGISNFILNIRGIIIPTSLFVMFMLMYRFIPGKKGSSLKKQIPGAIFAAIRLVCCVIFFFNICRCVYKFFCDLWKSCNNNINYDVALCNYIYNITWCRNKCDDRGKKIY